MDLLSKLSDGDLLCLLDHKKDDLLKLLEKYIEKKSRYDLTPNELTERNNKIIDQIKLEINKRFEGD